MDSELQVVKSNHIIEASYRLSLIEQRIILSAISQVNRGSPVTDDVLYSVAATDFARITGMSLGDSYKELKDAALRLKRREVRVTQEPDGKGKTKVMITGWVQTIIYVEGEGRIELRFSKDMLPYLTGLQREFTRYSLADVAKMSSVYGVRLYELLVQQPGGRREIALSDLRNWLQLEGRYQSIKDLKLRVIEPAVEQINLHSPLAVRWDQRKTGRRVTHLVFTYVNKTKAQLKAAAKSAEQPKEPKAAEKPDDAPGYAASIAKKHGLSPAYISRHARPGEDWEAAAARLAKAKAKEP